MKMSKLDRLGIEVSKLGFGCMRLPMKGDAIDREQALAMFDYAYQHGVNYYDTAWPYLGGTSEPFVGEALSRYPRDSFYVADKFNVQAEPDYKKQFARQLDRLQMARIDFYLLHGVTDKLISDYLDHGAPEYFREQKRLGKILYF